MRGFSFSMGYCISANSKECRAFSASVALNHVHIKEPI